MDIEFLKFLRDKTGQGFDFTRQIPNLAFSALTRVPFLGTALGIGSMFQQTPEQENFMKNIYSDEEYQNLLSQIPGLGNLNPVYMLGSGRGLLGALRDLERQKEAEFLESQRRGRRPGTGGGGGGGVRDSGGPTGGYSYDSGGRQGFGYGLKDGGLTSLLFRRR